MEGCQARLAALSGSLRARLIVILSLAGMAIAAVASTWSYYSHRGALLQFLDDELTQVAASAINYDMTIPKRWDGPRRRHAVMFRRHDPGAGDSDRHPVPGAERLYGVNDPIIIAPLHGRATDTIYIPAGIADGLYTMIISNIRARVLLATHADGSRFVVARSLAVTESMAAQGFWVSFAEFVLLTILYVVAVVVSLGLIFRAVTRLSEELSQREAGNLEPIDRERRDIYIPSEMHVFIDAINLLLGRIGASLETQKRFIADAAHEMRTPLTALSLQAESLSREQLSPGAMERVRELRKGIVRERELMTALLDLARAQLGGGPATTTVIVIRELFVSLIEELGPLADERDIDFGIDGEVSAQLSCPLNDLRAVMINLCSNALKYSPPGGQVDLACLQEERRLRLLVCDRGPGLGEEELERVFEPFYRVGGDTAGGTGTGLGLAIARAAAQRMGAALRLRNRTGGGLEACLTFTLPAQGPETHGRTGRADGGN